VPLAVTAPWLTNGALMTLDAGFNTVLVATVSVPVPLQVVLVMLSAADAVLKSCAAETDVAESASLPPLIAAAVVHERATRHRDRVAARDVSVPSCFEVGVVPDCWIGSLPPFHVRWFVPRFTCARTSC